MKVYLSGPMSGLEDYNRKKFLEAENLVKENVRGCKVINPCRLSKKVERRFFWKKEKPAYYDYLRYDIACLTTADAVFTLENWEKSKGAKIEVRIATELGIPVFDKIHGLANWARLVDSE